MSTFYQPFSLAAQTAFAGLDTAARQADLQRSIADVPGGFAKKTVSGKDYWYHQVKLANASLQQSYIGPDDEATRKLLAQHANPLAKVAQQQLLRMARAAIELGCVDIPVKHARVINRMKDYGFFSAGGVLVGTHVFFAYQNMFGVHWAGNASTLDLDFAHVGRNVSLALPENLTIDVTAAIDSLQMGFVPNQSGTTLRKADEPDFDLDFLTTRGRSGDKPVFLPRLNIHMQPLRFMELSLENTMRSTLVTAAGPIVVNLPRPERYVLHKLIVSGERPQEERTKANKDIAQAASLLDYLMTHDAFELAQSWRAARARGTGWAQRLDKGMKRLHGQFPNADFSRRMAKLVDDHQD